jgi:hypothetical protein
MRYGRRNRFPGLAKREGANASSKRHSRQLEDRRLRQDEPAHSPGIATHRTGRTLALRASLGVPVHVVLEIKGELYKSTSGFQKNAAANACSVRRLSAAAPVRLGHVAKLLPRAGVRPVRELPHASSVVARSGNRFGHSMVTGDRDPAVLYAISTPSDRGQFVAYNTALMLATMRTIRLVRNDCTQGLDSWAAFVSKSPLSRPESPRNLVLTVLFRTGATGGPWTEFVRERASPTARSGRTRRANSSRRSQWDPDEPSAHHHLSPRRRLNSKAIQLGKLRIRFLLDPKRAPRR